MKISAQTKTLLQRQVLREQNSSNLYISLASYSHKNDYIGLSEYLTKAGMDELNHRNKFIDFLNNYADGITFKDLSGDDDFTNTEEPETISELLDNVLAHEEKITKSVNEIANSCKENGDMVVLAGIEWVLKEQLEEIQTWQDIISRFAISTDKGQFDEWIKQQ